MRTSKGLVQERPGSGLLESGTFPDLFTVVILDQPSSSVVVVGGGSAELAKTARVGPVVLVVREVRIRQRPGEDFVDPLFKRFRAQDEGVVPHLHAHPVHICLDDAVHLEQLGLQGLEHAGSFRVIGLVARERLGEDVVLRVAPTATLIATPEVPRLQEHESPSYINCGVR